MELLEAADFINSTLAKYLAKDGTAKWVNGIARHSYHFAEMLQKGKMALRSGSKVVFHTLLSENDDNGQWLDPNEEIDRSLTESATQGEMPWKFFNTSWSLTEQEAELNDGPEALLDLPQQKLEYCMTRMGNGFEERWLDPVGNINRPKTMAGLKQWVTRDGLAIDGSATVAGISTTTYPRWKNAWIGPIDASDGLDPITSFTQLLPAMDRMMDEVRFSSTNGMEHAKNDAEKWQEATQKLLCDRRTYLGWKRLMYGRRDDMSKDLYAGEPVYNGIPIKNDSLLGLGATGIPAAAAHGAIVAGAHANTGEMYFLNTGYFKPFVHKTHAPKRENVRKAERQHTAFQDFQWWLNSVCWERQRQGVIWGYGDLVLN